MVDFRLVGRTRTHRVIQQKSTQYLVSFAFLTFFRRLLTSCTRLTSRHYSKASYIFFLPFYPSLTTAKRTNDITIFIHVSYQSHSSSHITRQVTASCFCITKPATVPSFVAKFTVGLERSTIDSPFTNLKHTIPYQRRPTTEDSFQPFLTIRFPALSICQSHEEAGGLRFILSQIPTN